MNSRHFCWVNSMKDRKKPAIRFKGFTEDWEQRKLGEVFKYEQPQAYIVENTDYDGKNDIPVLTAGQSFILGYTDENFGIKEASEKNPVIIFDDFTTSSHYVDFPFKVKSSAMKLLNLNNQKDNIYCAYNVLKSISYLPVSHERHWISTFAKFDVLLPRCADEQKQLGQYFSLIDNLITLHQRKHDKLVNIKKSMLEKMFPREGKNVPDIRFSGFTEDWEQRKLSEVGTTYTGLSGKTKEDFGHGNGKFVTYMNVFSNTVGMPDMTETVEIDDSQNKVLFGDVLFTTSSETPEEVGLSSVWLGNAENTYLNSFCFGYRPTVEFNPYYLAYMLRSSSMRKKITFLAQGISRYNISKNKMMDIEMPIPNKEEQKQIGSYFRNLDHLITLHQRKLEKLKNIKKSCLEKMFI